VVMVALTLLILKQPINLLEIALFAAAYSAQFFVMAGLSDYALGFWGSLIAGAILTLLLTALLLRRQPLRLTRWLILGLTVFFTLVYPLSGLLTDIQQANAFDVLVQVGLVVYTVVLALYIARKSNPSAQVPAPATAA